MEHRAARSAAWGVVTLLAGGGAAPCWVALATGSKGSGWFLVGAIVLSGVALCGLYCVFAVLGPSWPFRDRGPHPAEAVPSAVVGSAHADELTAKARQVQQDILDRPLTGDALSVAFAAHFPDVMALRASAEERHEAEVQAQRDFAGLVQETADERFPVAEGWLRPATTESCLWIFFQRNALRDWSQPLLLNKSPDGRTLDWAGLVLTRDAQNAEVEFEKIRDWVIDLAKSDKAEQLRQAEEATVIARDKANAAIDPIVHHRTIRVVDECPICGS